MDSRHKRWILISGGELSSWERAFIHDDDIIVGIDYGMKWALSNGIMPHYAVGDFDSVSPDFTESLKGMNVCLTLLNKDKDETDTEAALKLALKHHPTEIVLLGAMGGRFDHALANIHLLRVALASRVICRIVDPQNSIQLLNNDAVVRKDSYRYMSLLPLTERVEGITLTGFLYPLDNATLTIGQTVGVSNEWLCEEGHIYIRSGELLVLRSKDSYNK